MAVHDSAVAVRDGIARQRAKLVVFFLEGQRYALPLQSVDRVLPMVWVSALPGSPSIVLGVISVFGQVIPVLDIRCRFGLPPRQWGLQTQLLITRTSRRALALPVDEVTEVTDVDERGVTPGPEYDHVHHLAGIVSLSDGLLFICDLDAFLSLDEEHGLDAARGAAGQ